MSTNKRKKRDNKRQLILLAVFLLVLGIFFRYLSKVSADWSLLKISVENSQPVFAKIVSTQQERAKGLMYVKSLAPDRGMLFVFPKEEQHSFWMKNTYISLDMIFIGKDNTIVGVIENTPVLSADPRSVPEKSLYVLELPAGSAKQYGFDSGKKVTFHGPVPRGIK